MELYQFLALEEKDRIDVIWNCVCIGCIQVGGNDFTLYACDSFYIEVMQNLSKHRKIEILAFSVESPLLERYLRQNIEDIILI